ncbi:hypothetical protein [Oxynema aestuarii]|uniref:hypothetical protein n=1 Tax=Oxynema aestuarii TaxID=2874213 RepID=UPI001B30C179|nr:hypothetical protein [Oxynema aestuarii]
MGRESFGVSLRGSERRSPPIEARDLASVLFFLETGDWGWSIAIGSSSMEQRTGDRPRSRLDVGDRRSRTARGSSGGGDLHHDFQGVAIASKSLFTSRFLTRSIAK